MGADRGGCPLKFEFDPKPLDLDFDLRKFQLASLEGYHRALHSYWMLTIVDT